jgi:hypothetical protein
MKVERERKVGGGDHLGLIANEAQTSAMVQNGHPCLKKHLQK